MTDQDLLMMLDAPYQWTFQVPWGAALGTAGSLRNALQAALSRPDVAGISRVPRRMRLIDPKSAAEHVTPKLPNVTHHVVAGSGHLIPSEAPGALAAEIVAWVL